MQRFLLIGFIITTLVGCGTGDQENATATVAVDEMRPATSSNAAQIETERLSEIVKVQSRYLAFSRRNIRAPEPFVGWGGGLASIGDVVIGADSAGHFFHFDGDQLVQLDIGFEMNRKKAFAYIDKNADESLKRLLKHRLRAHDFAVRETSESIELYLAHQYWNPDRAAKVARLSRLKVPDVHGLVNKTLSFDAHDWEVMYECQPPLDFVNDRRSPFATNQTGGELAIGPDDAVYVSFGDVLFDGLTFPFVASQNEGTCFGKIMRFDPKSGEMREFARGLRNPQGLTFDVNGRFWASDQGPHGGDELNLIVAGGNYGWPYNTYGVDYPQYRNSYDVDYGKRVWPLAVTQGRHEEYLAPIYAWIPSVSTSALLQVGPQPVEWSGDLLMASLKGGSLHRLRILENRVVVDERISIGSRIRDMLQLDDGRILLWTDEPSLIELKPASDSKAISLPVPLTDREKKSGLRSVLSACASCHTLGQDPATADAPTLWGVYGRRIAITDFNNYSDALRSHRGNWDDESLTRFIADPQGFAPGSTMEAVPPVTDETQALLIEYLKRMR